MPVQLLTEAGRILESPAGRPLDALLDTMTPAAQVRPVLRNLCANFLGARRR